MSLPTRVLLTACLPLLTLALGWQMGYRFHQTGAQWVQGDSVLTGSGRVVTDPKEEVDIGLFWDVWDLLVDRYIEPQKITDTPLLLGAIRGLVESVGDPYTVFMPPEENKEFRNALGGQLQGIGAELGMREENVTVISPIKSSPAERAGIRPGDIILAVDDEPVDGKSLDEVVSTIRGEKGTQVVLLIKRGEAAPSNVTIVRDDIHISSVESEVKTVGGKNIGIVSLNQFGDESVQEVRSALQSFNDKNLTGLVLDLRYNGGGYLEGAVDIASFFLPASVPVVAVERNDGSEEVHETIGTPLFESLPMIVLINEGSASASEILAGALQDYNRATVMGMKSFGKGTVQEVIDLSGGASLRVTTARWLTPKGRSISKEGIEPDVVIDRSEEDFLAGRDPQLDKALETLQGQ